MDNIIDNNLENIPLKEPERQYYYIDKCKEWVKKKSELIGRNLTCAVITFGCQMNFKDSEKLTGVLEAMGFESIDDETADFVIYNTCTVRENANTRVYGRIGYLGNQKKKHPDKMIALCGCMMQEAHVIEKIKKSYRYVDIIFGTFNIYKLAELLYRRITEKGMIIDIWNKHEDIVEDLPTDQKYSFKAGVNIMYGCNNFCSYCIVPYVRGRERSRKPEDIEKEVRSLAQKGVVEIMLLGQNVNSYGKGLENPISFAQLIDRVSKIDGIKRIRFMTSHPKDLSDELINTIKVNDKVCRHIHLPMQSGSTKILKEMNRRYTKEHYLELISKLRNAIPDIAITTDIIVGFPGETEEDFEETLDVCRTVGFDSAYTFIYSKRTGTPAAVMENQVPDDVVKERFNRLLEVIQDCSTDAAKAYEGRTVEVLVEDKDEQNSSYVTGRLDNNLLVHFEADASCIGSFVKVKLNECKGFYFIGERV